MFDGSADALIAPLRAAIDGLLGAGLSALPGPELLELVKSVDAQARRLAAVDANVIAEVDARHLAVELKARDTETVLGELLLLNRGEAKRRVEAARDLGPRLTLTGDALGPLCPATADALANGAISPAHTRVVSGVLDRLPPGCTVEFAAGIEATLVEHARRLRPGQLAKAGARLLAILDPDGPEPVDREHERRRNVSLRMRADGSAALSGDLTSAAAAVWQAILDSLAAPNSDQAGEPDVRTPGQRRHDAFLDAGVRLLNSGSLPDCGGSPVTVVVTVTEQDLRERTGHARTEHGDLISITELLRLAAEADVVPVVLNDSGGVTAYGRNRRTASPGQRRALAARDKGCSFPGCDRPPSWCQAHHVITWLDDGLTDLDNLTLVCGHHHRTFERAGWECQMIDGIPHWRPPSWIDPQRKPRRNTAHPVDVEFRLAMPA
jgi:hypothetical protein